MTQEKKPSWFAHAVAITFVSAFILIGILYGLTDVFKPAELETRLVREELPPTIALNVPKEGTLGTEITLDGSASFDSDGTIETYRWSAHPANPVILKLKNPESAQASFVTDVAGLYIFTLTITDDSGLTVSESAIVTIKSQS